MAVNTREIYELVLEISRAVDRLDNKVDGLLADMKASRKETEAGLVTFARLRESYSQKST